MSWSDGRRLRRVLVPLALAGGLAGCFTPEYGGLHGQLGAEMQAIAVDEIPDRLGHYLRDELITDLNGTGSNPAPKYRLSVVTRERVQSALIDVVTRRATAATVVIDTDYILTPTSGGPPITAGTVSSAATYDRSEQRYANLRAARDAEIRDAKTIADQLTTRIAAALSTRG
jgi:LPS-assembly lipoprotein